MDTTREMDSETVIVNGTNEFDGQTTNGVQPALNGKTVLDYGTDFPTLPVSTSTAPLPRAGAAWGRPMSKQTSIMLDLSNDERASKGKAFGPTSEEQQRCGTIAAATNTKIELIEAKDGSLTVIIKGDRAKVEEARSRIKRDLQTQATKEINIPKEHHRIIVGAQGQALKALEAETSTRIHIPNRDSSSETISITGPRDGMERAAEHILRISTEQSKLATENLAVPRIFYPWVRGPNNETLDEMIGDSGIKINIPPSTADNEVINISGPRDAVHAAAARIRQIVASKQNLVKSVTCNVARAQHRYIQKNRGVADILRETGVVVILPEQDHSSDVITLRGDPAKLGDALAMVYARASSQISAKVDVPLWMHRLMIGPRGETLKTLVPNRDKLTIDFEDTGSVYIEGPPEEVKTAQNALAAEMARIEKEMDSKKIKVHPSLHRHVIGRGGALVGKMKEEYGVTIHIPDEATNSDEISIEGKKEGVKKAIVQIQELISKMENEKSKDVIIEQRLHRLLIGTKGENIQKIRAQFPSVNFSFPDATKKSDIINIRGDKNEVDKAAKQLQVVAKELAESNYQQTVPIFKGYYKHIVGKGGANIRKIREETQTKIDLPDESSAKEEILVTGKKANVEKAIALLTKMQDELASAVTEELDIPVKIQGRMLGGNRRIITDIEEECGGVRVRFPPEKSDSTKVTIVGPKEEVEKAKKILTDLAKDREANFTEDSIKAKAEFHRFLIGKGGARINKIRASTSARIFFPRETDEDKETIVLVGTKDGVVAAKKELEEMIKQLNETVELKFDVDPKYHGAFFKTRGLLKEIEEQNGRVSIKFPNRGDNGSTVTIIGVKQCAESAKARVLEIVDDYDHQTTIEVEVPVHHHRTLLANRGIKLQTIQNKYNVRIHFPERRLEGAEPTENDTKVTISGRDTKCEEAKEAFLALVPIQRPITVPLEVHKFLIGKGGETLRKIQQDNDANVTVPKDGQSEEIIVTGTPEAVEGAIADIQKKLEEYEAQAEDRRLRAWSMTISIPNEFHMKIIGPKGKTVNALREKHEVNISLPRGEEKSDEIVITGYETAAHACAAEIEELIAELRSMVTQEITLDARVHPRIIGQRGRNVKKLMDDFGVEIRFPRGDDPNLVVVTGKDENSVYDCIDHLRNLEDDFMQEVIERTQYISQRVPETRHVAAPTQVEMRGAPWQLDIASVDQFPEMGAASAQPAAVGGAWGASRRF